MANRLPGLLTLTIGLILLLGCNGATSIPARSPAAPIPQQDSRLLTTDRAQRAVDQAMRLRFTNWQTSGGVVRAQGVQQAGDGTGAQADLTFSNVSVHCTMNGTHYQDVWQRGAAIFRHYNDGRWVLNQIQVEGSFYFMCNSGGWEGNVQVN